MDTNKKKNTPDTKHHLNKLKRNKNIFITRIKILKQLKKNGNDVNIETIEKVFNINITKNKNKKTNNTNSHEYKLDLGTDSDINIKNKNKNKNKNSNHKSTNNSNTSNSKNNYIWVIILLFIFNTGVSLISFDFVNDIKFNNMTEQFTEIISRSIKSPQTEVYLKSKFDNYNSSIVYYYEVIDNLDSYTYKIRNTDVNDELRIKLLENIALKTKEIKTLTNIESKNYNSITLVGDYYVINNKYKIKEDSLNGKDINLITSSIKQNNIDNYNKNKIQYTISTFITLAILESFVLLSLNKHKKNT